MFDTFLKPCILLWTVYAILRVLKFNSKKCYITFIFIRHTSHTDTNWFHISQNCSQSDGMSFISVWRREKMPLLGKLPSFLWISRSSRFSSGTSGRQKMLLPPKISPKSQYFQNGRHVFKGSTDNESTFPQLVNCFSCTKIT